MPTSTRSTRRSSSATSRGCAAVPGSGVAAWTRLLAKVASGVAKRDGLLYVPPEGELGFLHPLPVQRLWGVGRITAAKLHERGVFTVGDVAALEPRALVAMLGAASGHHL